MSTSYIIYLFDLLFDDFEVDGDDDDNDHDIVVDEEHLHSGLFANLVSLHLGDLCFSGSFRSFKLLGTLLISYSRQL